MNAENKSLSGYRVVELSTFAAAPSCGKILADWWPMSSRWIRPIRLTLLEGLSMRQNIEPTGKSKSRRTRRVHQPNRWSNSTWSKGGPSIWDFRSDGCMPERYSKGCLNSAEDSKGKKIRTFGTISTIVQNIGGSPLTLANSEQYLHRPGHGYSLPDDGGRAVVRCGRPLFGRFAVFGPHAEDVAGLRKRALKANRF